MRSNNITKKTVCLQNKRAFESSDVSQESQYSFPYHYIPSFENGHFSQHLYWSWGFRYLGGIELILSLLVKKPFESLIDIGCGDGRFLREVKHRLQGKDLLGIDSSVHAISLANAMNPGILFECKDICSKEDSTRKFDVVTLIEVLEHIPVEMVECFVSGIANYQNSGGRLLVTVPHKNIPVQKKHYQHFDSSILKKSLADHYEIEMIIFFDNPMGIIGKLINSILENKIFILNYQPLLDYFFRLYRKQCFNCEETSCGRICFVGRKK